MNQVIISGVVVEAPEIVANYRNYEDCYMFKLQNKRGVFTIGIDKFLSKSIYVGRDLLVYGELKEINILTNKLDEYNYQKLNTKYPLNFNYISANILKDNDNNLDINSVQLTGCINNVQSTLIPQTLLKEVGSNLKISLCLDNLPKLGLIYDIKGSLVPIKLDKNQFEDYIIKVNKITETQLEIESEL